MGSATYVLVGTGFVAAAAAEGLRQGGAAGRIVLVDDSRRPSGGLDTAWCAAADVELRSGTPVVAVLRDERAVELCGGERVGYDKLLLAPCARPRRLEVPGAGLAGVHHLGSLADGDPGAEALRRDLAHGGRVVVVGAGWLGSEVAATARTYGAAVTLLDAASPLHDVLGPELGSVITDLHHGNGVDVRTGAHVAGFLGKQGRVSGVATTDGQVLRARTVVVAIGAVPDTFLAEHAGLEVDEGILADEFLRTSDPSIYAAGESALAVNALLGTRVSVADWAEPENQGRAAGRIMAGAAEPWDATPYYRSSAYDMPLEFWGAAGLEDYDEVVIRGEDDGEDDETQERLLAFWLRGGEVLAGMSLDTDGTGIEDLVRARAAADSGKLADPSVELTSFL